METLGFLIVVLVMVNAYSFWGADPGWDGETMVFEETVPPTALDEMIPMKPADPVTELAPSSEPEVLEEAPLSAIAEPDAGAPRRMMWR